MLGRITGLAGLQGWVKVHSDTSPRENIVDFPSWWLRAKPDEDVWHAYRVLDGRPQGKTLVARLEGIEDRDAAAPLVGCEVGVWREDLPHAAPGEFYWTDLVGMEVVTVEGVRIGPVDRLFETGANDVIVVRDERDLAAAEAESDAGSADDRRREPRKPGREVLVPWIRPDVVVDVDPGARRISVDWDPDF